MNALEYQYNTLNPLSWGERRRKTVSTQDLTISPYRKDFNLKHFTDISILLDRSGSMASMKHDMEKGLRTFLRKHKRIPSTRLTVVQFDSLNDQEVTYLASPIKEVEGISIHPRGNTPLIDAFCKLIDSTGERLSRLDPSSRPDQVLFISITDGQENASRLFNRRNLFDRITRQREAYKWQFIFMGANQDAIREGFSYGIPYGGSYTFSNENAPIAMKNLALNTFNYTASIGAERGQSVSSFTTSQREEAFPTGGVIEKEEEERVKKASKTLQNTSNTPSSTSNS